MMQSRCTNRFPRRQARLFQVGLAFAVWVGATGILFGPRRVVAQETSRQPARPAAFRTNVGKPTWGVDSGTVKLPAGLVARSMQRDRFNQLLFLGTPQLTHGDVADLYDVVRQNASLFSLAMMATVTARDGMYQLREVGLGHAYNIGNRPTIVTSEKAEALGANLSFIASQVLSKNQAMLDPPVLVVQTTTLIMFDVEALVAINDAHVDRRMRHLIWTNPKSGRTAMAVWLMDPSAVLPRADRWKIETAMPLHLVAADTVEDRAIHVDGNEVGILGPSDRAFALQRLPGSTAIPWANPLRESMGRTQYDEATLQQMLAAINEAIARSSSN